MSAYAHGVLTVDSTKPREHEWRVLAPAEMLSTELAEGELVPESIGYQNHIAMLGARGWRMFQVVPISTGFEYWFHREMSPIEMPPHDTIA